MMTTPPLPRSSNDLAVQRGYLLTVLDDRQAQPSDANADQHERQYAQYGPFHRSLSAGVGAAISGLGILGFVLVFLRQ
jgi:hypothetical protein